MNAHLFSSFMFLSHSIKKLDFFHWFYGRWFGRSLLIYCRIFLLIFPSSFLDGFINLHVGFRNYLYGPSGWQMLQLLQIALLISKSLQFALLQGWWNLLILAVRFYIISQCCFSIAFHDVYCHLPRPRRVIKQVIGMNIKRLSWEQIPFSQL